MRPEDDAPRPPPEPPSDEAPPPATWAGRRRAERPEPPPADEPPAEDAASGDEELDLEEPRLDEPEPEATAEPDSPPPEPEPPSGPEPPEPAADPEPPAAAESPAEPEPRDDAPPDPEPEPAERPPAAEAEPPEAGAGAPGPPEGDEAERAGAAEAEGEAEAPEPATSGQTVEADTLALADREAAQEAAMAGLKARTAEHEVQRPAPPPPPAEQPSEPAAAAPAAAAEPPAAAAAPPGGDGDDGPPRAKRLWARFLAASLLIVSSVAAATSISALVFVADFAEGLGGIEGVSERLDAVDGGDPQTILILGSDKRPTDDTGRSDTTILLRVDPDKDAISLLSIPRDYKVNIPNHGIDKFNAAYSYGGPKLTLRVVQQLTGLPINHVVNINFTGFADAVNAINCVFIDVDRQYYVPEGSEYSAIDPPIDAGYQKLCGLKALQYVRYRLEDNDLVRAARQQDFVREARQKIEPAKLVLDGDYRFELLEVFKEYTTSDDNLKDPSEVLELMKTFLAARNAVINEVHFPAELGNTYVTASDKRLKQAIEQFLGDTGSPGPPEGDGKSGGGPEDKGDKPKPKPKPEPKPEPSDGPPMDDASEQGRLAAQRIEDWRTGGGKPMVRFPVFYPTRLVPGSIISEDSRAFPIDGPRKYHGYKLVVTKPGIGGLTTEYYGVSGTNWSDPPILENESETREIDGREYLLYYDGDRLRMIAWKTKQASYWINNSLLQSLDEAEMIEIAKSMRKLDG